MRSPSLIFSALSAEFREDSSFFLQPPTLLAPCQSPPEVSLLTSPILGFLRASDLEERTLGQPMAMAQIPNLSESAIPNPLVFSFSCP